MQHVALGGDLEFDRSWTLWKKSRCPNADINYYCTRMIKDIVMGRTLLTCGRPSPNGSTLWLQRRHIRSRCRGPPGHGVTIVISPPYFSNDDRLFLLLLVLMSDIRIIPTNAIVPINIG